jgi:hypothetical protein
MPRGYNKGMQITYMPYLHMIRHPEMDFPDLNIKVWNYSARKDKYVSDANAKIILDALMASNVYHGRPIDDMGIISIGNIDFREFTQNERSLCNEVRILLFAGSLFWGALSDPGPNKGHNVVTSENFDTVWQNFSLEDTGRMSIVSGSIVIKRDMGYRISDLLFNRPEYVPTPTQFKGNDDIIKLLLKLRKRQKRLYRRIMSALEIVMQAYYNDTKVPESARILLMASAYEILFDLPEEHQRRILKEKFKELFVLESDPKRKYKSARLKGKFVIEEESIKVMWANQFYELRNLIIHGGKVKNSDYLFLNKQRQLDIAILFFALGVKKIAGQCDGFNETHNSIEWKKHTEPGEPKNSSFNYEAFVYEDLDPFIAITRRLFRKKDK